jgi:hypothetical protein
MRRKIVHRFFNRPPEHPVKKRFVAPELRQEGDLTDLTRSQAISNERD